MELRRAFGLVGVAAVLVAGCASDSNEAKLAVGRVEKLIGFDGAAKQNSESLAVDNNGDIYITFPFLGKVSRVRDGAATTEDLGSVPVESGDFGTLGVAIDGNDVLVGVQSKKSSGVWRFKKSGGTGQRIAGTEPIGFANDLFVADDGSIYVASSAEGKDAAGSYLGAIWRINDGKVDKWLVSPMLGGTGSSGLPAPIGANGIAVRDDKVYVCVTEQGAILSIPIDDDGGAGTPVVYAKDAQLNGCDGITFDDAGNLFVAVIAQSQIVRINKDDQAVSAVAKDSDGLDFTSSIKFGAGDTEGDLLAVNFAVAELLGGKTVEGPALLKIPESD
jgi:sugar lactone lactonase YvrE